MTKPTLPLAARAAWWSTLALAVALTACGGGSDEDSASGLDGREEAAKRNNPKKPAPSPEPAPAPSPSPSPSTDPVISANCGLANFSTEALQRINAYRAKGASCGSAGTFGPTTPLAWNTALISAATRHSTDMQKNNFTSHTGSDGSTAGRRITEAGYIWSSAGENIGWGFGSVQAMVDWWMSSPGHCANIMAPKFKDVGLACVKGTSSNTYWTYWTMDLGTPR